MPEAPTREVQLARMCRALEAVAKPARLPQVLPLPMVAGELAAWLDDPHQWQAAFANNWRSLIEDVERSVESCGPRLRDALLQGSDLAEELKAVRQRLARAGSAPDASLRRRLQLVSEQLAERLASSDAAAAALGDLRDAPEKAGANDLEVLARHLLDLVEARGHSSRRRGSTVADILRDDAVAIAVARGDRELPNDPRAPAGVSVAERLALAEAHIRREPPEAHVVVWLEYALAKVGWPPVVEIGSSVAVYDGAWLRSALLADALDDLPPEVRSDAGHLKLLLGVLDASPDSAAVVENDDSAPVAYVRVDLGVVLRARAERLARQSAEAIVSLASLYGLSPSIWQPESSWISYVDGEAGAASFGARRRGPVSVDDRVELERGDNTARVLPDVARVLGPKLPVRDPAIAETCTLLGWLRQARQAPASARLLLCDRVIEQVSGWAGVDDRNYFVRQHLGPAWAYRQMRREIANAGWAAEFRLGGQGSNRGTAWNEIYGDESPLRGRSLSLQALLENLEWLHDQLPPTTDEYEELRRLRDRCVTGQAAAAWWHGLEEQFGVLETRARRTRNALMHGGPIMDETVDAVVDFAEQIAADALNVSLEGRVEERDLVDHFLERRKNLVRSKQRLRAGDAASVALFWESAAGP